MLSAPLVMSNIAVDYLASRSASDASNRKGAIVEAPICPRLHEVLWLQLDHPFRAACDSWGSMVVMRLVLKTHHVVMALSRARCCTLILLRFVAGRGRLQMPCPLSGLLVHQHWICPSQGITTRPLPSS